MSETDTYDGSAPLPDSRREKYAQLRQNVGPSQAYRSAVARDPENLKASSCKAAAWKIDQEPMVKMRREYLAAERVARLKVPETLTAANIRDLMHEVTVCLELAHDTAEGTVASESDLSKIRQRLTVHIGRLSRSTTPELERAKRIAPANTVTAPPWCCCE